MLIPPGLIDLAPDQIEEIRSMLRWFSKGPRKFEETRLFFGDYYIRNCLIRLIKIGYLTKDEKTNEINITERGIGGFKLLTE
jgi:uncharacterized radical SAM superfamily Fe-S cluster-containing enzyme